MQRNVMIKCGGSTLNRNSKFITGTTRSLSRTVSGSEVFRRVINIPFSNKLYWEVPKHDKPIINK
jgi:hypothetical protein